jgi:hypothetical protein
MSKIRVPKGFRSGSRARGFGQDTLITPGSLPGRQARAAAVDSQARGRRTGFPDASQDTLAQGQSRTSRSSGTGTGRGASPRNTAGSGPRPSAEPGLGQQPVERLIKRMPRRLRQLARRQEQGLLPFALASPHRRRRPSLTDSLPNAPDETRPVKRPVPAARQRWDYFNGLLSNSSMNR